MSVFLETQNKLIPSFDAARRAVRFQFTMGDSTASGNAGIRRVEEILEKVGLRAKRTVPTNPPPYLRPRL